MQESKALPIFSQKKILTVVNFIKKERPDLWVSWKTLEDSSREDLYRKTVNEILDLIRPQNWTKTLSETTALMWSVRKALRAELGLPVVPSFTKEQITKAVNLIKEVRPDLWEVWKTHEKNSESYQPIRKELVKVIQKLKIAKYDVEMQSLITGVRMVVLVEAGVWTADEI